MKKVLSIILAAVLLVGCLPFTVFAAGTVTFSASREFTASDELQSGTNYLIPAGVTMTVRSDMTLYIPSGTKLEIEEGGTLNVLGTVSVLKSGSIYCRGTIKNSGNIQLNSDPVGEGETAPDVKVQFRFPDLASPSVNLQNKIDVYYDIGDGIVSVPVSGADRYLPLRSEVKIYAKIREPRADRDKFDDALLKLKFNEVSLEYVTGEKKGEGYFVTTASTGGDISYAKWTSDNDFLTTLRIVLPSGEGYECVPRYPDRITKTEDGTIIVKYGEPFSFKVELDEAYDMSNYEVYIYNGYGWLNLETDASAQTGDNAEASLSIAAKPDAYGYYNIPSGSMVGDLTISVRGVMKNSTINLIGNLLETFKNIFNMLREFFDGLKQMFSGLKANNG